MAQHVIHLDRQIYASPEQVWGVLTDVGHSAETIRSVNNVQVLNEVEGFGVGTRWREDRTLMGHKGTEELEVVEAVAPSHFALRTKRDKDVVMMTYTLTPLAQGTRLSLTLVDDMSGRNPISQLAWNLWGEVSLHSTKRMLVHDLDDVANAAESAAIGG
jgi:uncharacterized protein YndB with AHSA1/START domain